MSRPAKAEAALALHRFGMGPRPGSIAAIEADPRGALLAELDRPAISELAAANLPSSAKAFRAVTDAYAKRQAKAIVAKKEQNEKRLQMAEASAMMEGAAPGTGEMAAKMAAEAIPDPGRPIYLEEARIRIASALGAESVWSSGWSGSGRIISASRPTRSAACPALISARPPALTCPAASLICCWPPKAIRRCCSISTRRFRWARIRPPASTAAAP